MFYFFFFPIYCLIALVVLVIVLAGIFSIYAKSISIRTRSRDQEDFPFEEKEAKIEEQKREVRRTSTNMAGGDGNQRRTLMDFVTPGVQDIASSIACINVDANNFELKPALISMVQQSQFGGNLL